MTNRFSVSSTLANLLLDHAVSRGLDRTALLQECGLTLAHLSDPLQLLPAEAFERLCLACERDSGDTLFGCDMAHRLTANGLHGLNILMDCAPNLGEGLRCLGQYLPVLTERMTLDSREDADSRVFTLRISHPQPHYYWLDAALLALLRNMSRRVGKTPATLLKKVWINPSQHCARQLEDWGIAYEYASSPAFMLARDAVRLRHLKADEFFHRAMLAHWQSLRPATLEQTDELAKARLWLKSSDQPIEHIASLMGYSQPGNFTRAFRKQYGMTPRQYRNA
ncbi:AraC family transcriptional regulator ligand-binding domain-containing protein [Pseudomonas sp. NPDC089569]|uniref:AraC family transcriptional regulator ligand-binding domain-containing protein n=1 Tax=Pseudomonas sp. NPDC089569 TaxID=3390722 RepID=UPI003CFC766F